MFDVRRYMPASQVILVIILQLVTVIFDQFIPSHTILML